jgi:hypothetical protein
MTPRQFLRFVCCGCIYVSYAPRQRCSTGTPPQSLPNPAAALFVTFPSGSTACKGMLPVFPSGVPLSQAGSAVKAARSRLSSQDCFYRQAATLAGPPTPPLCCSYSAHLERYRQSRLNRDARSRTEAGLTSGQPGRRARFIWNITSIGYWIPSWFKPTKCWFPTSGGPRAIRRR